MAKAQPDRTKTNWLSQHALSEDIPGDEGAVLDPTPIDLGDGRGAVDSLEVDGFPAPTRLAQHLNYSLTVRLSLVAFLIKKEPPVRQPL